jgi:thymidine kinase
MVDGFPFIPIHNIRTLIYKRIEPRIYYIKINNILSITFTVMSHLIGLDKTAKSLEKRQTGYLELIVGSMFSGKTSYLLEIYKKCKFCDIPIAVINYEDDVRYSDSMLSTHDKQMIPCIKARTITDAVSEHHKEISEAEVVLINEGQFFPDIEEQVRALVEKEHKRVFICGLDGDFERKPIGQLQNLFPLCDEIIKLKSLCSICRDGTPGIFSFRITNEVDQVVIGSSNYIPLCRKCYNSETEKKEQNSKPPRELI